MSTAFITTITLIGNSNIHNLVKEIGVRYDQLLKDGYDSESMETVAKLFYGEDKGSNHPSYQEIRAKWFCLEECDTDSIYFRSANWPLVEIQDHILKHASVLDPRLIVFMEYKDEGSQELGSCYKILDKGKIISFESKIDLSNFYIIDEDEEKSSDNELTMEDVYRKWNFCRKELFDNLKKKYVWAKDDYFANWK
jgi:hypothetical protein